MGFMRFVQLNQNAILDNLFWVQPFWLVKWNNNIWALIKKQIL